MSSASRRASRWWRGEITGPGNIEMNNSTPLVSNYYLTSTVRLFTFSFSFCLFLLLAVPVISVGPGARNVTFPTVRGVTSSASTLLTWRASCLTSLTRLVLAVREDI